MNEMVAMGQTSNIKLLRLHLQAVQNFLGRVDDPRFLRGEILDCDEELSLEKKRSDPMVHLWTKFYCLFVAYYFYDYDLAAEFCVGLIEKLQKSGATVNGISAVGLIFYEAVALLASNKWHRRLSYIRRGIRKLEFYAKHAPLNFLGKVHLLKAELAVATKSNTDAIPEFMSAILFSRESGFTMEEALANERLGVFFLSLDQTDKGANHLRESVKLYQSWGSVAKVEQLRAKFPDCLP